MEFKFRADDNGYSRPSTYIPPPSTNPFFSEHALTAGAFSTDGGRAGMESKTFDMKELIQREIEKNKVREEILTAEILRRRELEAEVRRELMIERAIISGDGVSLFDSSISLLRSDLWGLPLHYQNGIRMGIGERLSMISHPEVATFKGLPFPQRGPIIKRLTDGRNSSMTQVNEGQALLAKLINSNAAGIKRKAETLAIAGANGTASTSTSKKPHKEWRCALCQVSTTCERSLNDHLHGRKHKSKEALQRASIAVNPMTSNSHKFSKKSKLSADQAVPTGSSLNPKDGKSPKRSQEDLKNGNTVGLKMQNKEDSMINGGLLLDKKQQLQKFWCQMCDFETNNEMLMEAHQNGKKHMTLLLKNGGAVITISTVPEDVQRVERKIEANVLKEDLMDNAEEINGTAAGQKGEVLLGSAEESNETAAEGRKKDSLGNTDGEAEADEMKIDGEENTDGYNFVVTGDSNEIPCGTKDSSLRSKNALRIKSSS